MANLTRALSMPDGTEYEFIGKPYYGTHSGVATNNTYFRVTIDGFTSASLVEGVRVYVKFAASYTTGFDLNVSNTGDKSIRLGGETPNVLSLPTGLWNAGQVVEFIYDGTNWLVQSRPPKVWYGVTSAFEDVQDKAVAVRSFCASDLVEGAILTVSYTHDSTVSSPRLNVSSTGAIAIYRSSNEYDISAGAHTYVLGYVSGSLRWMEVGNPISSLTSSSSKATVASSYAVRQAYFSASTKYSKPSSGIPASDLASGVIPSAVSELTNDAGYITLADLPIYDGSVT